MSSPHKGQSTIDALINDQSFTKFVGNSIVNMTELVMVDQMINKNFGKGARALIFQAISTAVEREVRFAVADVEDELKREIAKSKKLEERYERWVTQSALPD